MMVVLMFVSFAYSDYFEDDTEAEFNAGQYNNTFYNNQVAVSMQTSGTNPPQNIRIKNNIFYDTRATASNVMVHGESSDAIPTELDYNIYVTGNTKNDILRFDGIYGWRTLAEIQATPGWELNGQQIDPQFVNISYGIGVNSHLNDMQIQPTSPAKDAGVSLSGDFTTDKTGLTRPQGAAWDIGAYEVRVPPGRVGRGVNARGGIFSGGFQ